MMKPDIKHFVVRLLERSPCLSAKIGNYLLLEAIISNNIEAAKILFAMNYSNVNCPIRYREKERSLLMISCELGRMEMAKILVQEGAHVTKDVSTGMNCLQVAFANGHLELGNWMICDNISSPYAMDNLGNTALDYREACVNVKVYNDDVLIPRLKSADTRVEASNTSCNRAPVAGIIINGNENNVACGSGFRGTKWLQEN